MSQMEPVSSLNHSVLPGVNGHFHCDYEGNVIPEHQAHYINTCRKKNKHRLNDQLIPKPTDINMAEEMTKIASTKEHPYASHISQFAMFPSFHSSYGTETNHLTPNCAPDITLKSKTFGGPYRHEILALPMKSRKKAAGKHGFLDPLKGEKAVFCPTPPNKVLPKPKPRLWDFSHAATCQKNMERTQWVTSYQTHFTECGRANPLIIDDFKEKMNGSTGRQKSHPLFVPSKPNQACRRREGSSVSSTCSATAAGFLNPSLALKKDTATATRKQQRPQEITAQHNEEADLNPKGHSQSGNSIGSTEAQTAELSHKDSRKLQAEHTLKNSTIWFDKSPVQVFTSQNNQEGNTADTERLEFYSRPLPDRDLSSLTELCGEPCIKKPEFEVERNVSSHSQLPWPAGLPGIRPEDRTGTVGGINAAQSLLELQNSFSKSSAHHRFNNSITYADVNLRDNVVTGRKHNFYGINSCYLHG
ncbi:uncharacterized protein C7orf31 homolog [Solea solea]|uniref:uncharacterized protein C7orf31 homolog n=1 Tax=Solea solea TaxID=90069 RepID=UPI00272C6933|nr:uncharacterized protein C7orf31 homolog [Solea solea]